VVPQDDRWCYHHHRSVLVEVLQSADCDLLRIVELPPCAGTGASSLTPVDQLRASATDHLRNRRLIRLNPENRPLGKGDTGFAPILVNPDLDDAKRPPPATDSIFDDLLLFIGEMGLVAARVAEPALVLCHPPL
jgi:hypothetical protein